MGGIADKARICKDLSGSCCFLSRFEPGQPLPVTTLFLGELRGELLTFRGSMVATDFCR